MLLGWLLVSVIHVAIVTAGFVWPLPNYSAYYNRQADAFARGQTHLILRPPAGLLALPDPYDPDTNRPFRQGIGIHDSVLLDGKFYLYWGPVPALLLMPVKACGMHGIIGDEWLVLAFLLGTTLMVSLILRNLWRSHFSHRSPTWILLGIVLYGLATPVTYFLSRAAVYEAAIAGGQFFLLLGVWLLTPSPSYSGERAGVRGRASIDADRAVRFERSTSNAERSTLRVESWTFEASTADSHQPTLHPSLPHSPPSTRKRGWLPFLLGGISLATAVGCRASLAVAVVGLAIFVAFPLLWHSRWKQLTSFSIPLLFGAAALASYNFQRFGSITEFGQKYQLTGANYRATPALFAAGNASPSTWSYLTRPVVFDAQFPFVNARGGEGTFPAWVDRPAYYESKEAIVGLLVSAPLFLLAGIPLLPAMRARWRHDPIPLLVIAGALAFAPILVAVGSTQRYLMDLWPCLAILTTAGLWTVLDSHRQKYIRAAVAIGLAWTIGLGLLLSASGPYEHLKTWNPTLYQQLGGQ